MKARLGNQISIFKRGATGRFIFADEPYVYFSYRAGERESLRFEDLDAYCVYLLELYPGGHLSLSGESRLKTGDVVQVEGKKVAFDIAEAMLLVVGVRRSEKSLQSVAIRNISDLGRVDKPWGHEIWLTEDHSEFAFKQIFIKAGNRTSLQYHRIKTETIALFSGTALLHGLRDSATKNDRIADGDIVQETLPMGSILQVTPGVLHRLEAVTDLLIYEASTPHLDDVVRAKDDYQRSSADNK